MTRQESVSVDTRQARRTTGPWRVLVSNDDGIDSPGLQRLAIGLAAQHEVVVAAPEANMSGSGTAIGRIEGDTGIDVRRHDIEDIEGYAVAGPPGLAVMAAALGAFGQPPDLVVSGVNAGLNTGHSVIHSGTVGAALTAHTFGARGVAISLAPTIDPTRPHDDPQATHWHWDTAVPVAIDAVAWVLQHQPSTALNVNVPGVPADDVRGVRWAPLDEFGHFSVASTDVEVTQLQFDVTDRSTGRTPDSDTADPDTADSDTALCLAGYVTLTPLAPVEAAAFPSVRADEVVQPRPGQAPSR